MPGAVSTISHGGFQSELMAQLVFSAWGTVVPTPNPEDHGIDLNCSLVEVVGKRAWARAPYTVQVKSNMDPWVFDGPESVRWLIQHPLPLFLAVVDKAAGRLRVYHTFPRFFACIMGGIPERLILRPSTDEIGHPTQWEGGSEFSLSAPIIDLSISDLTNDGLMDNTRTALEMWIDFDNDNLGLLRAGLMRFRMPHEYKPNVIDRSSFVEQGHGAPSDEQLRLGIRQIGEALDCLGSQFFNRGDLRRSVKMALVYRDLFKAYPAFFGPNDDVRALMRLYAQLANTMPGVQKSYIFAGIDEIEKILESAIPDLPDKSTEIKPTGAGSLLN